MCHLYLIRHGQASFGQADYDQLSAIGLQQATIIGNYLTDIGLKPDRIVHGTLSRQRNTAEVIARQLGCSDSLEMTPDANEFSSEQLFKVYLPRLRDMATGPEHPLYFLKDDAVNWWQNGAYFVEVLQQTLRCWQEDTQCPFESWADFQGRVSGLINQFSHAPGQKIILATSGGVIAAVMQYLLRLDNQAMIDLNLTINNASLSEVRLFPDQPGRLLSFNNISPLIQAANPALITRI